MPIHKDVKCSLRVGSRILNEYESTKDDDATNPNVFTRYCDIDATEGQNFSIEIELGGMPVCSKRCSKATINGSYNRSTVNGEHKESLQKMFFSKLNIVEERSIDTICNATDPRLQSLGKIEVNIKRATHLGTAIVGSFATNFISSTNIDKKAVKEKPPSHGVQLGPDTEVQARQYSRYSFLDDDTMPYICFIFLYRSRTWLENMAIIPHVPFHFGLTTTIRNAIDTTKTPEERLVDAEALIRTLKSELKDRGSTTLKRKRTGDDTIKAEEGMKPRARIRGADANVVVTIDLTEDD